MHPEEIVRKIKYDLIDLMTAHPIITIGLVVGGFILLTGMGQATQGRHYLDEAREKRGNRKMLLGMTILIVSLFATGLLDPMLESLYRFWTL